MTRTPTKLLTAALGLALLATGCGGDSDAAGSDGKTTIRVSLWNYATTPEFKAIIDGFQAANPDITVQPVDILADDYPEKLTTMLAGGDTTDVLTMKNVIDYSRYAGRNQLLPLTDEVDGLDKASYSGLDAYDIKGEYYALPYRQDFWVLFYNKAMVKAAGISEADLSDMTWADYARYAKQLTQGSGDSKVYGTYQHTWRSVVQAVAAAQTGGDLLGGDYTFMTNQYELALGVQDAGATIPWATASSQKVTYNGIFSTGKAAMLPMGTWFAAQMLANAKTGKTDVAWGMAPLPQVDAGGATTSFGSPTAFAVNKKSKHADAARKFVLWASGEQGATAVAKAGVVPAFTNRAILDSYFGLPGMPSDAVAKKAFEPGKIVLEMPVSDRSADVDQILTEEHQLVMTGQKSVGDGIAEMGKRVKSEVD